VKLTHRQTAAVSALLDLCVEAGGQPIAYRAVADRLGVAPTTAYRMLRLAERLGYVRATYAPRAATRSVGRSPVLFAPTDLAHRAMTRLSHPRPDETWEATRSRLLEVLASSEPAADREALRDILAGLAEPGTPIDVAGRTIAALMISLEEARGGADDSELLGRMARAGTRFGLSTLGGMLLGLAWANRATRTVAERLEREAERFQSALAELSPEQSSAIAAFAAQLDVALRDRRRRRQAAGRPAER
jgi:DNA-binding Lrp family transcriptional regulator